MATNPYISQKVRSEQHLYEDLVIESLKFYGQDVYYIPREIVNKDKIFGDDIPSRFSDAYKIEMYIENTEGFDGEGDLFTKFGIELRDQATFVVARRRWKKLVGENLAENNFRPREGDIIYLPMSQSMFEVMKVETETPFYQLSNLPTFRLQAELFDYSDEDFDTGISEVDVVEYEGAFQYKVTMNTSAEATPRLTPLLDEQGRVSSVTIVNAGAGYGTTAPTLVTSGVQGDSKFGTSSLYSERGHGDENSYLRTNPEGTVELFVKPTNLPNTGQQALFVTGGDSDKNEMIIGVNSSGQLVYSYHDNDGQSIKTLSNTSFSTGSFTHLLIGHDDGNLFVYVDGTEVLDSVSDRPLNLVSERGYSVGAYAAREYDGISYAPFSGRIDEFRVLVGDKTDILTPRLSGGNLTVPSSAFDSGSTTALLRHFDGDSAQLTATLTNGSISAVNIVDSGDYYLSEPTVTIASPFAGGQFIVGETVTQTNTDFTIKGEVTRWSDSDRILQIAHVGSTDGTYKQFTTNVPIVGASSSAEWVPKLVEDLQQIQESAQNKVFDDFEGDFLDFSESNPFGDIF